MRTFAPPRALALLALAACTGGEPATRAAATGAAAERGPYLYVWAGDADHAVGHHGALPRSAADSAAGHSDFLAVIDADSASPTYGQVIATSPTGFTGTAPHHTELELPAGGRPLFANAYATGKGYLFDVADPSRPRIAATLDSVPGMRTPHSFARLTDGRVVATMQYGDRSAPGDPGGLALFDADGRFVRATSAADAAFPGARVRPYAIDVSRAADRIITTSSPMDEERTADVVQLWRLSDLALLKTIPVPPASTDSLWRYPFEPRFLGDGRTALMNTYYCAFYALSGLDGDAPTMERVLTLDFPRANGCSVPAVVGHWWIMPVSGAREYVVLDVSDPRRPRKASVLATDSTWTPHWIAREPGTDRFVVTSEGTTPGVRVVRFDSTTGRLAWDERFRERPDGPLGVSFDRASWPHGATGRATPHGAVFSRSGGR
jgi:hypothetical protein